MALADNIHYLNSGPAVTVGPISNAQIASSSRFNPAVTQLNTDTTRLTLLDFTANIQMQGLGEFNTVFENMSDQIDSISDTFEAFGDGDASVGDVLSGVNDLESTFDENIELLANSFYIKPGLLVSAPLTPFNISIGRFGALSVSASSLTQARASILHGPISFDIDAQSIIDSNDADEELDPLDSMRTTSSIYFKQAQVFNADVAWSQPIPSIQFLDRHGIDAVGGLRATLIGYNLQKQLYPLKDLARQASDDAGDLTESVTDDVMAGFSSFNFNVSLDAGVTLQRDETVVGLTLYNLNSPELTYQTLGGDCASIVDSSDQEECFHAEYFASVGDIALEESHRLTPRLTLDASQSFFDNQIAIAGVVDLLKKNDLFGEQSQNLNIGLLLQPKAWYWPRLRLGVGKDFVDLDPTQLGLGLSFFNFLQIDTQMTTVLGDLFSDDLTEQGNALRSASVAASINLAF
jgi:hypothetical protein